MDITLKLLSYTAILGFILGYIVNKTNFCTMGAVSDWVNIGDLNRFKAWMLATSIAVLGVSILEFIEIINLDSSRPPYRSSVFFWPRYLVGGLMFGIGMTLTSGCGNKTLIRLGGGNLKSFIVILIAGSMAYLMTRTGFYGLVFHSWMSPISPDLAKVGIDNQSISTILSSFFLSENLETFRFALGIIISLAIFLFVIKAGDFFNNKNNFLAGLTVGTIVVISWFLTGGQLGKEWIESVEFMDNPLPGVGVQSLTFINPMGETLIFASNAADLYYLTFGVTTLLAVIAGSFAYAITSNNFRFEWFVSLQDFKRHVFGSILIGIGGVLSLGCTIGQGVTGVSTLALGSFLALASIILGAAITMKIEYYSTVYENNTFLDHLKSSLADLKIIPNKYRTLEKI
ncbi:MAG: YeeE/YedE family protein [Pseudomonadota bacterium]|nr:YeeE/YedE family protein [Pseudomonadota bacterium]